LSSPRPFHSASGVERDSELFARLEPWDQYRVESLIDAGIASTVREALDQILDYETNCREG
jgi:hypothetical protein